jgi:hypothetical protein
MALFVAVSNLLRGLLMGLTLTMKITREPGAPRPAVHSGQVHRGAPVSQAIESNGREGP